MGTPSSAAWAPRAPGWRCRWPQDGRPVIGVDQDAHGSGIAALRAHDIPVFAGDPTDPAVLRAVRLERASSLVALCTSDATNVAIATAARQVPRQRRAVDLRCSVHLEDAELTQFLRGSGLGGDETVRIEFFNMHERGARALVAEHLVLEPGTNPHLVVVGLGQLGRAVLLVAAQQWAEVGDGPLTATLVDREASSRMQALEMQHPGLVEAVAARLLTIDVEAPTRDGLAELTKRLAEVRPQPGRRRAGRRVHGPGHRAVPAPHDRRPDHPGRGPHARGRGTGRLGRHGRRGGGPSASPACGCSPCSTGPARRP